MTYSTLYELAKKTPKPLRNAAIRGINKFRVWRVRQLKNPKKLVYFVTYRCNARCKHCFYWRDINSGKNELKLKEIGKIAESIGPIESLSLTGGEAELRADLVQIMEIFYNNGTRKITIPVNGLAVKVIRDMVMNALDRMPYLDLHIQVSLDGMKKFHDKFRGVSGIFDNAVETAEMLKKIDNENLHVYFLTTISNSNYKELEPLIKFVKKTGIDHKFQLVRGANFSVWRIDKSVLSGFDPRDKSVLVPPVKDLRKVEKMLEKMEYREPLYKKVQELKLKYSIDMLDKEEQAVKCLAGKLDGVLYPNGDVAMCEMTVPFANVRDYSCDFKRLWNSEKAKEMRKKISRCFCTHSCNLVNSMLYDSDTLVKLAEND